MTEVMIEPTDKQLDAIEPYVQSVQRALNLSSWRVVLSEGYPREGLTASITPTDGTRYAALRLADEFWELPPDYKTVLITHEVLHLTHHDVAEGIFRYFREQKETIPPELAKHVKSTMVMNFERMVDSLSYGVGMLVPQWKPEWDES